MEAPLQNQYRANLEPLGFGLGQPSEPLDPESCPSLNPEPLHGSQVSPNGICMTDSTGSSTTINSASTVPDEEECLVDSQPMCFKENPFLVANRKGKGRPPGEQILSGPPVGYGKQGQLQPWLFNKARRCLRVVWRQHGVFVVLTCAYKLGRYSSQLSSHLGLFGPNKTSHQPIRIQDSSVELTTSFSAPWRHSFNLHVMSSNLMHVFF